MKDGKKITASREESTFYMNQTLPMRESFDLIQRDLMIGERMASFYFINGLNKDDDMLKLMDALLKIKKEDMPAGILQFMEMAIPYTEVALIEDFDQVLKNLFSGVVFLWMAMREQSQSIAVLIRQEVWKSRIKINHFVVPEMVLSRLLSAIRQ